MLSEEDPDGVRRERRDVWRLQTLPLRDEPVHAKLDRNFAELVQEIRLAFTAASVIFAFLMTLPFQARFHEIAGSSRSLYSGALVLTVLTLLALMAPVTYHRLTFRRNVKNSLVRYAHTMVLLGFALLSLSVLSSLWLALSVAGVGGGTLLVALSGAFLLGSWWVLPVAARVRTRGLSGEAMTRPSADARSDQVPGCQPPVREAPVRDLPQQGTRR